VKGQEVPTDDETCGKWLAQLAAERLL